MADSPSPVRAQSLRDSKDRPVSDVVESSGPLTPTQRRASKKMNAFLGVDDDSASSAESSPSRNSSKLEKRGIARILDRRRSGSVNSLDNRSSPRALVADDDEMSFLRNRVAELELQVVNLEQAAEERERVVEHYRAKYVATKKLNRGIRDQAKGMFKALLDGDNRKLDELIRSHYKKFETEEEPSKLENQLTPRGTHFKAPDGLTEASEDARKKAFEAKDTMFTSHEMMKVQTRQNRVSSDPIDTVVSPISSPRKVMPKLAIISTDIDASKTGPSIKLNEGQSQIMSGSTGDLVDYLVNGNRDREFLARFLLLYRMFMSPSELLEELKAVMKAAPASELEATEEEDAVLFIQPMPGQSTVKQRIAYILNRWLQDYFDADFRDNVPLRKTFSKIAQSIDPSILVLLETAVEKSKEHRRTMLIKQGQSLPSMSELQQSQPRTSLLGSKKNVLTNNVQLLALHPMEVARQMTLIDFDLLDNVEPLDFLKASKDSNKASTVKGMTNHFNKTSAWVATEVIQNPTPKDRAQKIKFFISLAQAGMEIKNFNLLMSVLGGLNYSSVQRLKKSWKLVSSKSMQTFNALESLMSASKNYMSYRNALSAADYPKLPYFGVFLRDLQFIDVGNDTWIGDKSDMIVNFEKVTIMEALLQELDNFKTYNEFIWTPVPVLQTYLKVLPSLDEESLHKKSVAAEPITTSGPNYLEDEAAADDGMTNL